MKYVLMGAAALALASCGQQLCAFRKVEAGHECNDLCEAQSSTK